MRKERIELTDTTIDVMMKMAGGNPGALTVVTELLKRAPDIDKDSAMGGLGPILSLDTLGIYESRIWELYKDVCGQNITKMLAVLRGHQLGFLTQVQIDKAIGSETERGDKSAIDMDEVLLKVNETLSGFNIDGAKE